MTFHVRRAAPGDAAALVELARAVGAEPEGWLITNGEWRTPSEERRYLRAVRRHSHAAVFVAETADGIVGRISLARDTHPASEHVADLGLMVAATHRRRGVTGSRPADVDGHASTTTPAPPRRGSPAASRLPSARRATAEAPPK